MTKKSKIKNFKNQILENQESFETHLEYFSEYDKRKIKKTKKLSVESIDKMLNKISEKQKINKKNYYYEFIKNILNKFPDSEAYVIEYEKKGSERIVPKQEIVKINNNLILIQDNIFFIKDVENFKNGKINLPIVSELDGQSVYEYGLDDVIKGLQDLINGKNTEEAKKLALTPLTGILYSEYINDKLKYNINNMSMKKQLNDVLNLKSITELAPIKMFYLFFNDKALTEENLKEVEKLNIEQIKNIGFIQKDSDRQYFIIPKDNYTFKIYKLYGYDYFHSSKDFFKKYVEKSKLGTYTANKYELYKKNVDLYKTTVNYDINC